ncbi:hypothetical protein KO494_00010 [Lacinutrix sp. C3R15]|uniref:hypothetical protein n=1 Tax=Flavobacteriaceae TaxID=49546 RepID=UPI001C083A76|nr:MULTISPECIES: hypothetical protein [Flavobacteriaceae]MBU2937909.1 hypothetical protein [Lacinutrix sp. C3R15]MDO6621223.1 hypothetical protein [Oceanihabitans sp. 1_MG-2023]|tara:strand:- start:9017 stop:9298 length:282 start_codon:yes stop_codon:yes gene_type:complete
MEEILNNLLVGETLYITANGTHYIFNGRDNNLGVTYTINENQKTLPLNTINEALDSLNMGEIINTQWYINYNEHEYTTRRCNLQVLNALLQRL